ELDLAAAVVRVGPAERHSDETLGEALAARTVHGRRAVDTQTAPVPGGAVVGFDVRRAGHQDGVGCRSGRVDLRATEEDQRRDVGRPTAPGGGRVLADHQRVGLDRDGDARLDEDEAVDVDAAAGLPFLVRGDVARHRDTLGPALPARTGAGVGLAGLGTGTGAEGEEGRLAVQTGL